MCTHCTSFPPSPPSPLPSPPPPSPPVTPPPPSPPVTPPPPSSPPVTPPPPPSHPVTPPPPPSPPVTPLPPPSHPVTPPPPPPSPPSYSSSSSISPQLLLFLPPSHFHFPLLPPDPDYQSMWGTDCVGLRILSQRQQTFADFSHHTEPKVH